MIKKDRGRPNIPESKRKFRIVTLRIDQDDFEDLYMIKKKTGFSHTDILRLGLKQVKKLFFGDDMKDESFDDLPEDLEDL